MNLRTLLRVINGARPKPTRWATPRQVSEMNQLRTFRPQYWGERGLQTARLHKIDVSPVNGAVVAYYDVGGHRYLWRIVKGRPCEIRRYQKGR